MIGWSPPAMTATAPIELKLFGPPQLLAGGRSLHIGSRKSLALVALLALDGSAARESLARCLWPELGPEAARRNLRKEVFRLRRVGLVLAESGEGALALALDVSVDLLHFRAALARGDDAAACALARPTACDGLDGVAGEALDECLARWRRQLTQDRHQARARRASALLQAGDHAGALSLHLQAVVEDRCDETAARAAMQLLAKRGERAAALALYAQLVAALRDELDTDPGPTTAALAAELRSQDSPEPAASAAHGAGPTVLAVAPPLLAAKLPYVARPELQAQIESAWGAGRRVYLSGEPGAGKTRLACECAAARGPWLRVTCVPNDLELPYAAAVRALRALREAASDSPWPDWARRELAQLLPELGTAPLPLATDEARTRLVAAFAAAWSLGVHDNFHVVLLDDWQWCDAASVELFDAVRDEGVAWLVVYRSAQLPAVTLQRMRADVDHRRGQAVQMPGLAAAEVLALVRLLSRSPGGTLFAQRLQVATAGNPFFVIETLRFLFEQGLLSVDASGGWRTPFDEQTHDYTELPVPPSVRQAVLGRVRALGPAAQRLLEVASLLGDRFELALLQQAVAPSRVDGVALLEHATAARLVEATGGAYRFAHDLVRQCLAEGISLARRRLTHTALARALETAGAPPALVAAQLEGAGQAIAAVPWRMAAARAAVHVHALADALSQFHQALVDGAAAPQAMAIQLGIAGVHRVRGDAAAVEAALAAAVQVAAAADPATRLEAQLTRAEQWCSNERLDDGLALLDALAADLTLATLPQRARALDARAQVQVRRGQAQSAAALHAQAIALLGSEPGHAPPLAALLVSTARTAFRRGDLDEAARLAQRAVAVYGALDEPGGLSAALTLVGVAATLGRNDSAGALAALEQARALAARCGHVPAQRAAILNLIKLHTDGGNTAAALALLDEGEALAPGYEHMRAELGFMEARYFVHYLRGELGQARAAADRLVAASARGTDHTLVIGSCNMVIDLYLHSGELQRARALIELADVATRRAGEQGRDHLYSAPWLAKRAWLALAEGRPDEALALLCNTLNTSHFEDRYHLAWVGAAAALAQGDVEDAASRLQGIDIHADAPTDLLANTLVQRLALALARGHSDPAAQQRAQSLLVEGRVPALEAQALRRALQPITSGVGQR